jgi:hypothetical protein
MFPQEVIDAPDIVVSHIIKGRIPEAIHKPVNQLLETDKTIYYERMAFCFEIPTIYENVAGNRLNLSIGGVRAYNHENLYSKKTVEKFKVFIGFKNLVCCNLCVSTDGFKSELRVMSVQDLFDASLPLPPAHPRCRAGRHNRRCFPRRALGHRGARFDRPVPSVPVAGVAGIQGSFAGRGGILR